MVSLGTGGGKYAFNHIKPVEIPRFDLATLTEGGGVMQKSGIIGRGKKVSIKLEKADVVLSLDADFLSPANNSGFFHYAAALGKRRKSQTGNLNRLVVVESIPS